MEDSQVSISRRRRLRGHAGNYTRATTNIPHDLIVEILSRLPAKPLIRFQTVSKLWFSTIHSKNFIDMFLTRSKTRPHLLLPFIQCESRIRFILSAPEHNNKEDEDKSPSIITLRHDMTISDPVYYIISRPLNGLVCCIRDSSIAVCNPATRQTVKLPDVTSNGGYVYARLGYDPVEDQYSSFLPEEQGIRQEYLVCTVTSSEKQEWRKVKNTISSYIFSGGICIDGSIYYETGQSRIARFDVRTETMELIKAPQESDFSNKFPSTLLNYKGKLGGVDYTYKSGMRLWILEDAEKQEWSSMTCDLPSKLNCLLGSYVVSKGDVHTGELMVFHPWSGSCSPFCVWFYDFKKECIIRKVEVVVDDEFRRIHGIGEQTCQMLCYPGYFENIRFL